MIMDIKISKKDIVWNYFAQFFNLGAGFIVLPVILRLLSPDEIGMNYLMLSVSSLVALADFGFSSQFGRNITYVFSGAQELRKEGMSDLPNGEINYHLLSVVIETAKAIFRIISIIALMVMLSLGTLYMYRATNGFTSVHNALFIWILFSFSTYFNMYYMYYGALLSGAAMIMESKKATMLNRVVYILISFFLLFCGYGLISVVIANFISPFVGRWYSYKMFYRDEIRSMLYGENPTKNEIKGMFKVLWFNAKKLGINFLGAYGIQQSGTFIIGLFLTLKEVASYGLMCQLFQIVSALALGVFTTMTPLFYKERVEGSINKLVRDFSFSSFVYIVLFIVIGLVIILSGQSILKLIGSSTMLPAMSVMIIYFIHMLLENFHSLCALMIVANNQVPFVKAAITSGFVIIIGSFLILKFTTLGLLGVVLVQLIIQSCYNHWKWPLWVFADLHLSPFKMVNIGVEESLFHSRRLLKL